MAIVIILGAASIVAAAPAASQLSGKTGEIDLTFTQRSPLSAPKEIARRLNLKESELGADYDLSTRPYHAYIPKDYDPNTPVGIFVYLGYKDSVSVARPWEPVLDKAHLIFITPVCHHGSEYPGEVPAWQTLGLALDAVDNLKRQYNIDTRRIYLMSWNEKSLQISLGAADVFTGFVVCNGHEFFQKLMLPNGASFPPAFTSPPASILRDAKQDAFVVMDSDGFTDHSQVPFLMLQAMRRDGFENVLALQLSLQTELHYPNFTTDWLEQKVLPFFNKAAGGAARSAVVAGADRTATPTTRNVSDAGAAAANATQSPAAVPEKSEAERQLGIAKMYVDSGHPAMARPKLEAIIKNYPNDPAASAAKDLLKRLPQQ